MCKRDNKFGRVKSRLGKFAFRKLLTFCHITRPPERIGGPTRARMLGGLISIFLASFLVVGFLGTAFSDTQLPASAVNDIIKVEVTGDEIVGLNTLTNVRVVEKLKDGELVTSALSKGKVGAVLTNHRLLGFNATNNAWTSFGTFFNKDVFPDEIKISANMAVAIAKRRVYAYTSTSNNWEFELIYFQEQTISSYINDNLIFVKTSARLLAFSFYKHKWFSQNFYVGETVTNTETGENFVAVTTYNKLTTFDNRKLTFDAKKGTWVEERLRPDVAPQTTNMPSPSELQVDTAPDDKSIAAEDQDSKS